MEISVNLPPDQIPDFMARVNEQMRGISVPPGIEDEPIDLSKEVFYGPDGSVKVYLTAEEHRTLLALLEREHTSRPSYDGLRQLLSLSHPQAEALLGLLRRI